MGIDRLRQPNPIIAAGRLKALRGVLRVALLLLVVAARSSHAFSMLAHQEIVDRAWEPAIKPLLERKFPGGTDEDLRKARAHAYGGAIVADIGYFPFGDELFSELIHYVRSGDFAAALIGAAKDRNSYAFALGHLAHYSADTVGHPEATNPAVAKLFPKLAEEHGSKVTYADSPKSHLQTEFRFDVLEVARLGPETQRFQDAIGFEVHKEALAEAFRKTYGLDLEELFESTDLAIGTFRWGVRSFLRAVTNAAWHIYEDDLKKKNSDLTSAKFVFDVSADEFEKEWGTLYREPSYFGRFVGFFMTAVRLVPGVGTFERLVFKPLPEDVITLFEKALDGASERYRKLLAASGGEKPKPPPNLDLDTGRPTERGEYEVADEAYAEWLHRLAEKQFTSVDDAIRKDLLEFYRDF